jgi:hypothetical protein
MLSTSYGAVSAHMHWPTQIIPDMNRIRLAAIVAAMTITLKKVSIQ